MSMTKNKFKENHSMKIQLSAISLKKKFIKIIIYINITYKQLIQS